MARIKNQNSIKEAESDVNVDDVKEADTGLSYDELGAEERVFVNVPKKFKLTLNNHAVITIEPGAQMMAKDIATHWYSIANGVTIVPKD